MIVCSQQSNDFSLRMLLVVFENSFHSDSPSSYIAEENLTKTTYIEMFQLKKNNGKQQTVFKAESKRQEMNRKKENYNMQTNRRCWGNTGKKKEQENRKARQLTIVPFAPFPITREETRSFPYFLTSPINGTRLRGSASGRMPILMPTGQRQQQSDP